MPLSSPTRGNWYISTSECNWNIAWWKIALCNPHHGAEKMLEWKVILYSWNYLHLLLLPGEVIPKRKATVWKCLLRCRSHKSCWFEIRRADDVSARWHMKKRPFFALLRMCGCCYKIPLLFVCKAFVHPWARWPELCQHLPRRPVFNGRRLLARSSLCFQMPAVVPKIWLSCGQQMAVCSAYLLRLYQRASVYEESIRPFSGSNSGKPNHFCHTPLYMDSACRESNRLTPEVLVSYVHLNSGVRFLAFL